MTLIIISHVMKQQMC